MAEWKGVPYAWTPPTKEERWDVAHPYSLKLPTGGMSPGLRFALEQEAKRKAKEAAEAAARDAARREAERKAAEEAARNKVAEEAKMARRVAEGESARRIEELARKVAEKRALGPYKFEEAKARIPITKIIEPPKMPRDIHVTAPTEAVMPPTGLPQKAYPYTRLAPAEIAPGEEAAISYMRKTGIDIPEYFHKETAAMEKARVAALHPVQRLGYELEFLKGAPAVTAAGAVKEDIGVAIGSFTFGAVMAGPRLLELPQTITTMVMRPSETIGSMVKGITSRPVSAISEIAGGVVGTYGISKAIGFGISKYRTRSMTTSLEVGKYDVVSPAEPGKGITTLSRYKILDLKGRGLGFAESKIMMPKQVGLAQSKLVIGKSGKIIGKYDVTTIYKAEKPGEVIPSVSIVKGPKATYLGAGKGIEYLKTDILWRDLGKLGRVGVKGDYGFTAGKVVLIADKKMASTLSQLGITSPAKIESVFGSIGVGVSRTGGKVTGLGKFYSLFAGAQPKPSFLKFYKPGPVITKGGLPPAVSGQIEVFGQAVGKSIIKGMGRGYTGAVTGLGSVSGAVGSMPYIGRKEYPGPSASLSRLEIVGPWARMKQAPIEEEEVYISLQAGRIAGIGGRQTTLDLQQSGIGQRETGRTLQQLGMGQRRGFNILQEVGIGSGAREMTGTRLIERPLLMQREVPALRSTMRMRMGGGLALRFPPIMLPPASILPPFMGRRYARPSRRPRKRRYKYREKRYPFPTIRQLIGIKG